jgi:hypothetical protein
MLSEAGTALHLVLCVPEGASLAALVELILVALIRASTSLLQVPRHITSGPGFDEGDYKRLVLSNRLRAAAPARSGLVLSWPARAIS